jgi:precorrin-2/cobalt-factor-2 C20-methyltransferase
VTTQKEEPTAGRIAIIGVGPGDPELLTLRAARLLSECEPVLHAGSRNDAGFAFEVIAGFLRRDQRVQGMGLIMRRGTDEAAAGYERIALALIEEARAGRRAAFVCEGDPMLFGTGSYVLERLAVLARELNVEVVPGVSALASAAARLGWAIARKDEILTVCPATYHESEIGAILDRGGPSCWFKAAAVLPKLVEELRARGRLERAALVERVGRPDERIFHDLNEALGKDLSYFSLVLVH